MRARDLFLALMIPDLFMERVENDEMWSLFSPDEAQGLTDVYGDEFEQLYVQYEKEGIARRQIKARKLWNAILTDLLKKYDIENKLIEVNNKYNGEVVILPRKELIF